MSKKTRKKSHTHTNNTTIGKQNKKQVSWQLVLIGALVLIGGGWFLFAKQPQAKADMIVYKSPSCGCCGDWIDYMEKNGYTVNVENVGDMDVVKRRLGVPNHAASCHTAKMGNYVIEGHVPVEDIQRLMEEKPDVAGIAAPGMPIGSPGMEVEGEEPDQYEVVTFSGEGKIKTFARH